ncbi:MAG: hypothetical protein D6748_12680 [Calditrichaeota bacterium]|nr:MAG: hypothetical protein D6748_12680 [Calditrichota bacterium]
MVMRSFIKFIFLSFLCLWFLIGCVPEAPHSNPLDPYLFSTPTGSVITGTVFSRYQPVQPLKGVMVQLLPDLQIQITDQEGHFEFQNLEPGEYQLIAFRDQYLTDTIHVSLDQTDDTEVANFFLDALPQVVRVHFFSEHIDQWWPGEIYQAVLQIIVNDADGLSDIDSLHVQIPSLNFQKTMEGTARVDSFVVKIEAGELPDGSLQYLIETPSFVEIIDKSGGKTMSEPLRLTRIIDVTPLPVSPANLENSTSSPLFEWQPVALPFSYSHIVQVYRVNTGIPVLIFTSEPLPESPTAYQYPDSLGSGTYFWTIGILDNLNNFSRSKEASFIVP